MAVEDPSARQLNESKRVKSRAVAPPPIPTTLKDRLKSGRVIPFVGAGVSRAVLQRDGQPLFPTWKDLLLAAAGRLADEGKLPDEMIVRGNVGKGPEGYGPAAEAARKALPGAVWIDFLKQKFARDATEALPESLALAREIWNLGSLLVITTNYDDVLSWACPAGNPARWDIEAPAEQARLLREGRPERDTVWHLHGYIGNAADIILTPNGFERLYPTDGSKAHYEAARTTLRQLLASRSLLFLGFSFDDPVGAELDAVSDVFAGTTGPHYALVRASEVARLRQQAPTVQPVEFSDFGEQLIELIRELGKLAPRIEPAAPVASGSPSVHVTAGSPAPYSIDNRPFSVPFRPKGDRVIGREAALRKVREQLTGGKPTSIGQTASFAGLGGLGKTQLAVEYAWQHAADYTNGVVWLTADSDIAAQLTRLAVEARWVAPESDAKTKLDIAQHRIRSFSDCLIVFDNVDDRSAIEPYLPLPTASPHLLATSRTEQAGFVPVELKLLDEDQSVALLALEAGRQPQNGDEWDAAREIARELGRLPLAIEIAGAYLLHRAIGWRDYLALLRADPSAAIRAKLLDSYTGHEADLYKTLSVHQRLLAEEPHLGEILDVLTWSGPVPIGTSLLAALLNRSNAELMGSLALGVKLKLLERPEETSRYGLHRLVRRVRREEHPIGEMRDWVEEILRRIGEWFGNRRRDFADLPTFEAEIDHLHAWREQALEFGSAGASRLAWLTAYPPHHHGQYAESRRWLEEAQRLLASQAQAEPELEAWILADQGTVAYAQGDLKRALRLYEQSLEIRRCTLGEDHPDTAMSLDELGGTYNELGDSKQALALHQRALEIRERILGHEHPDTAIGFSHLGITYSTLGDWKQALLPYQRALEIRERVLGHEHPLTAASLNNLGTVYGELGDLEQALLLHQQDLEISERVLGQDHPATAASLNNLGSIYRKLGDSKQALVLDQQAFEISERVLGHDHPVTAKFLNNLGAIYEDLGDREQALALYEESIKIRRRVYPEGHPSTATTLYNLAGVLLKLTKTKDALVVGSEALMSLRRTFGPDHRHTVMTAIRVAHCLIALGRRREAFSEIEYYRKNLPEDHDLRAQLVSLERELSKQPLRPGFRPPAARHGKKKSKKKR